MVSRSRERVTHPQTNLHPLLNARVHNSGENDRFMLTCFRFRWGDDYPRLTRYSQPLKVDHGETSELQRLPNLL
jgi:hypothetical protein